MNASGCTGYIVSSTNSSQNRVHLSFTPAFLTNYSLRYSDGQIPTISTNFACYQSIGSFLQSDSDAINSNAIIPSSTPNYNLLIPGRGSISLSFNEFTTNRVLGFDITCNLNREPLYSVGKIEPYLTRVVNPVLLQGSFQIEIGDYQLVNLQALILNKSKINTKKTKLNTKNSRTEI